MSFHDNNNNERYANLEVAGSAAASLGSISRPDDVTISTRDFRGTFAPDTTDSATHAKRFYVSDDAGNTAEQAARTQDNVAYLPTSTSTAASRSTAPQPTTASTTPSNNTFEEIIDRIRPFGAFQKRILVMNGIMVITAGIHLLSYPMLAGRFDYWCRVPDLDHSSSTSNSDGVVNVGIGSTWTLMEKRAASVPSTRDYGITEYDAHCRYYSRNYKSRYAPNVTFNEVYSPIADYFASSHRSTSIGSLPFELRQCSTPGPNEWYFSSPYFVRSLISEFKLVCSRAYLEAFVHTIFAFGCMVGVVLFGWMADTMGRRRVVIITVPGMLLFNFLLAATQSMSTFLLIRFLQGLVIFGNLTVMFCITMELTSPSRRAFVGNLVYLPWGLASMIVALVAYAVHSWRSVQVVLSLISLLTLSFYSDFLPESARWLALKGRYEPAVATLAHAAKINGVTDFTNEEILERLQKFHDSHVSQQSGLQSTKHKTMSLLQYPLRFRTLLIICIWFQCALANHGINFYAPRLGSNPFVAYAMLGIGETLAPAVGSFLFGYGRRMQISGCFAISALMCLLMLACVRVTPGGWFMLMVLVASFATDLSYRGAAVHAAELFPTTLRSFGLGVASAAAFLGSAMSSLIVMASDRAWWAPPLLFALALSGSALCTWLLPETKSDALPETVSDVVGNNNSTRRAQTATAQFQHSSLEPEQQQQQRQRQQQQSRIGENIMPIY